MIGNIASHSGANGYMYVEVYGKRYYAHRVVWALRHGKWPEKYLDHIDGNRLNNRIENLREATQQQNAHNAKLSRRNKSGYKGVSWNGEMECWVAHISVNKRLKYLGKFSSKEEAAAAYDRVAIDTRGEFAKTNATLSEASRSKPFLDNEVRVKFYNPVPKRFIRQGRAF